MVEKVGGGRRGGGDKGERNKVGAVAAWMCVERGGRRPAKNEALLTEPVFCKITVGLTEAGRAIDLLPSLLEPVGPILIPD